MKSMRDWMLGTAATVLVAFALIQAPSVFADACNGAASGNWNVDATWSTCHEGTGSPWPQAGDTVNTKAYAITVNVDSAAVSVAAVNDSGYFGSLTINSGVTLTLSGTTATTLDIQNASNTATINGTVTMSADGGGVTNAGTVTVSSTGTLKTRGGLAGAGTYTFDAASTVVYNKSTGDTIASGKTYGNLTLGDSGTTATYTAGGNFTAAGTLTVDTGDLLAGSTATITLSGSGTPFSMGGADRFTEATSTISYTSGSGATVTNTTYNNLTINGTGTFNLSGDLTISGNLSVLGGTLAYTANLMTMPSGSLTVTSPGVFSGAGNSRVWMYGSNITVGGTGTSTFWMLDVGKGDGTGSTTLGVSGDLTINGHMTLFSTIATNTLNVNSYTITFPGNDFGEPFYIPTATGTVFNAGTSTIVYSGNNAVGFYGGNMQLAKVTYYNLQLNNAAETYQIGANLVVNNTVDVTAGTFALGNYNLTVGASGASGVGHLIGSGTITQSAGATATLKGQGNLRSTSSSSCTTPGAGSFTFNNLTLGDGTNSRTSTVCGDITVSNNLTVQASHTLTVGSNNLTVGSLGTLYTSGGIAQAFDTDKLTTDFTQSTGGYFTYDSVNKWVHAAGGSSNTVAAYVTSLSQSAGKVRTSVKSMDTSTGNRAGVIGLYGSNKGIVGYFKGGATPTVAIATVDFSTTTITEQATASYTMTSGDVIRLDISGNSSSETVTLYVNDVQKTQWVSANLSAYTGTSWGIFHANGSGGGANKVANWDDVEVANIYGFGLAGNMVGAGTISQTGGTTTFKGAYLRSSSTSSCAAPASGSFTFNALSLGNASNTVTNTACGSLTAASLTITASDTFNAGSSTTITLTGSGTPLTISGTFTPSTSTLLYNNSASGATVTATTFYNLTLGDGSSAKTFTAAGDFTVSSVLTVDSLDTFDANSKTITLSGGGTPFVVNGTFTPGSGATAWVEYTGSGAKVTATTTYHHLKINSAGTVTLGTASGQTITTNGKLLLWAGTADANTYGPNITIKGALESGTGAGTSFYNLTGTWTKGSGTIAFTSTTQTQDIEDVVGGQDLGIVSVQNTFGAGVRIVVDPLTVTQLTVATGAKFSLNQLNFTVTGGHLLGDGTLYCGNGNNTCSTGTVTLQGTGFLHSTNSSTCVGGAGAFNFYNLTMGDGATTATTSSCANADVANILTVNTNHTWAMNGANFSVGTGSSSGFIVGGGAITSAAGAGTMVLWGAGNLGGTSTTAGTCSGTSGSYSFYRLNLGDGITTKTTSACGNFTVNEIFSVLSNHTLDGKSATIVLSGSGTPFSMGGADRFTEGTSTVIYSSPTGATVTGTTYNALALRPTAVATFTLGGNITVSSNSSQALFICGNSFLGTAALDTSAANNYSVTVTNGGLYLGAGAFGLSGNFTGNASTVTIGGNLTLDAGTYRNGASTTVTGDVSLTSSGRLSLNGGNLTVNGGDITGTGTIYCGNGDNTCSAGTTTVTGTGTVGGGSYTFYNLNLTGGGSTTTFGGALAVKAAFQCGFSSAHTCDTSSSGNYGLTVDDQMFLYGDGTTNAVFNANASAITLNRTDGTNLWLYNLSATTQKGTLNAGSSSITLAGITQAGLFPPMTIGTGTFNAQTGTVTYTGNDASANITFLGTTYYNLAFNNGSETFVPSATVTVNCDLTVTAGTLALGAQSLSAGSSTVGCGDIAVSGTLTQSASGTTTVIGQPDLGIGGGTTTFYNLTIGNGSTATNVAANGNFTVTNVLTQASGGVASTFNGASSTVTLAGTGTPWVRNSKTFSSSTGTIQYTGSGSVAVEPVSYWNLTLNGSGTYTPSGDIGGFLLLSVTSGTFEVSTRTLTSLSAGELRVNGGTLSMNTGGTVTFASIAGPGLTMSSGTFHTADVSPVPKVTTAGTEGTNVYPVSFTGGTLDVAALDIRSVNGSGIQIGSGVTITNFNKIAYTNFGTTGGTDALLNITRSVGQSVNLLNHTFPASWSGGECNVKANTAGTVTMWDWTGGFGGEQNDCDNGGEVIWQGGPGAHGASGSPGYPAIY